MADESKDTTHFGFRTVAKSDKAEMVADVFHSVAAKYDLMNDLMSFGIHRVWKRFTIDCSGVRRGQRVLDLAGGTGDLTAKFSRLVGETGEVVLADINSSMLKVGREKLRNNGIIGNVNYVQANAEALPFPDNHFDCITIAFGLRNVTEKEKALASMFRVLKPGGRLLLNRPGMTKAEDRHHADHQRDRHHQQIEQQQASTCPGLPRISALHPTTSYSLQRWAEYRSVQAGVYDKYEWALTFSVYLTLLY